MLHVLVERARLRELREPHEVRALAIARWHIDEANELLRVSASAAATVQS